jgi:hypothetical protein
VTTEAIVAVVTAVITALGATKGRDQFNKWRFKRNGNDRRTNASPAHCPFNPGIPSDMKDAFREVAEAVREGNRWSARTYRLLYKTTEAKGDFDLSMAPPPKGEE